MGGLGRPDERKRQRKREKMKSSGRKLKGLFLAVLLVFPGVSHLLSQENNQVKLLPEVEIVLPENSPLRVNWILPPVDRTLLAGFGYERCFSVDAGGFPWVGLGGRLIMNPVKNYCGILSDYYSNFTHLGNGALVVATGDDFGFIAAGDEVEYDEETGYPLLAYQPFGLLPGQADPGEEIVSRTMFRGQDCLYFVVRKSLGDEEHPEKYEVYCLKPGRLRPEKENSGLVAETLSKDNTDFSIKATDEGAGAAVVVESTGGLNISISGTDISVNGNNIGSDDSSTGEAAEGEDIIPGRAENEEYSGTAVPEFIPVYVSAERVTAVSGNGEKTFVAHGQLVLLITEGASWPQVYYEHPTDIIMGLDYSEEAGLFYATNYSVGLMSEGKALEFMRAPSPRIFLKGDSLYVMLSEQAAVLQVEKAAFLSRYNAISREVVAVNDVKVSSGWTSPHIFVGFWPPLLAFILLLIVLIDVLKNQFLGYSKIVWVLMIFLSFLALLLTVFLFLFFGLRAGLGGGLLVLPYLTVLVYLLSGRKQKIKNKK